MTSNLDAAYRLAAARYGELGVDTEVALAQIAKIPVSLHCWQGDDVGGFEPSASALGGGMAATGNYPGQGAHAPTNCARTPRKALSLIPGRHRFSLHAIVRRVRRPTVDRDAVGPEHFAAWIDWAKALGIGLDFNPTFFSHPKRRRQLHAVAPRPGRCATSGSRTGRRAGGSPRRWGARSAPRASRTSGSRTA